MKTAVFSLNSTWPHLEVPRCTRTEGLSLQVLGPPTPQAEAPSLDNESGEDPCPSSALLPSSPAISQLCSHPGPGLTVDRDDMATATPGGRGPVEGLWDPCSPSPRFCATIS